jgi:hypothetical protein
LLASTWKLVCAFPMRACALRAVESIEKQDMAIERETLRE